MDLLDVLKLIWVALIALSVAALAFFVYLVGYRWTEKPEHAALDE